jgi:hypothetical protein
MLAVVAVNAQLVRQGELEEAVLAVQLALRALQTQVVVVAEAETLQSLVQEVLE